MNEGGPNRAMENEAGHKSTACARASVCWKRSVFPSGVLIVQMKDGPLIADWIGRRS